MLNFDFATLTLVQSSPPNSSKGAHESPQMTNQFIKRMVPSIDKHWQAAPAKITKLTRKTGKTMKKGRIAAH